MNNHNHSPSSSCGKLIPMSCVSSFYELSAILSNGKMEQFAKFDGKVTLVVNMASCDKNTKKELLQLNELVSTCGTRGLVVLVFPSNQLGKLEPLENTEMSPFFYYVRPGSKFEPRFVLFSKVLVNGSDCHPIYEFLKMKQPYPADDDCQISRDHTFICWDPVTRHDVSGNYEKFIISHDGTPVKRYTQKAPFEQIKRDIEIQLKRIPKQPKEHLHVVHH
ncbi:glutathione peroxidase 1-like [Mytilus trossulus]|uniref:glutathione peroxidase 1-like n=1 Tax=Mytilus trossulus TaxID=6551 RepID=UPI0030058DB7